MIPSEAPDGHVVTRLAIAKMALLAVSIALFSFRFVGVLEGMWIHVDPGIRGVVTAIRSRP